MSYNIENIINNEQILSNYKIINNNIFKNICLSRFGKLLMKRFKFYASCSSAAILIKDIFRENGINDTYILNTIKCEQTDGKYSGHFVVYSNGYVYDDTLKIYIGDLFKNKIIYFPFGEYIIVDFKKEWYEFNIHSVKDLCLNVKKYLMILNDESK